MSLLKPELLNQKKIIAFINPKHQKKIQSFEIFKKIDSTNSYLLQKSVEKPRTSMICFAEEQTAGRGRFNRIWVSPKNSNIYLSILWKFDQKICHLPTLSLVIAVAIVQALKKYNTKILKHLNLRWPNDLFYKDEKFGGILLESKDANKVAQNIVIGIGLNTHLSKKLKLQMTQSCTDIYEITGQKPKRNKLAGLIIDELFLILDAFEKEGLQPFLRTWYQYDGLLNQNILIQQQGTKITGLVIGVDNQGALILRDHHGKLHGINSGTIKKLF